MSRVRVRGCASSGTGRRSARGPSGCPRRRSAPAGSPPAHSWGRAWCAGRGRRCRASRRTWRRPASACANPLRPGRPLLAATIPTTNAPWGTRRPPCGSPATGGTPRSRRHAGSTAGRAGRAPLPEPAHRDRHGVGGDEELDHLRRRRLVIDRHPAHHVQLARHQRVEHPHVHQGEHRPVARRAEEPRGVLRQGAVAVLAADAGQDRQVMPFDARALQPVEARDPDVVVAGEQRREQCGLLAVAGRRPRRV